MILRTFLLAACILATSIVKSKGPGQLTISISGFENLQGHLLVAVFDSEGDFLRKVVYTQKYTVKDLIEGEILVDELPAGEYAVSIVHDENTNGKLDSNFIGIPREPFGFSNNPVLKFGPPSFADAKFRHIGNTKLDIVLKSYRK